MNHLSTHELALFRTLKKTAIVLILMLRLDKPVGEKELAELLNINQETARTWLRTLADDGLVIRQGRYGGYHLTTGGRQLILPIEPPRLAGSAENPRSSADSTPLINNNDSDSLNPEIVVIKANAENPRSPLWELMHKKGITNKICDELASRPEITEKHVENWETVLQDMKKQRYTPGLLVTVLRDIRPGDKPPTLPEKPETQTSAENPRSLDALFCSSCHQAPCKCTILTDENFRINFTPPNFYKYIHTDAKLKLR